MWVSRPVFCFTRPSRWIIVLMLLNFCGILLHVRIFNLYQHNILFFFFSPHTGLRAKKAAWPTERTPALLAANQASAPRKNTEQASELCICASMLVMELQSFPLLNNDFHLVASIDPWHWLTQFLITEFLLKRGERFIFICLCNDFVRS